ncbi:purine-nucleoside phosphorylase [Candidatus Woesearchaeota archaeon]|nr:purine-nucleoside phosphorylase [Candidatus Woesearchaeota archaeon]
MTLSYLEQALEYRDNYEAKVAEAANYIKPFLQDKPEFGLTLGSGLGNLSNLVENQKVIRYSEIPNFPLTTIPGHEGNLIIGSISQVPIIVLKGRKHYYEVADLPFNNGILQVIFPIHVLAELGIPNYFSTNAAGGLNYNLKVGDFLLIQSHINLLPNPLLGKYHNFRRVDNKQRISRFQPMNSTYDPKLTEILEEAAYINKNKAFIGVYIGVTGPSYETEAECIAFRDSLGADAVGMSTTGENIVAKNRGMKIVSLSLITNVISINGTNATSHEEVKSVLENLETNNKIALTIKDFFRLYKEGWY